MLVVLVLLLGIFEESYVLWCYFSIILECGDCWGLLNIFHENVNEFCLDVIWLVGQATPCCVERYKTVFGCIVHTNVGQNVFDKSVFL